jgi:hypothetical protein
MVHDPTMEQADVLAKMLSLPCAAWVYQKDRSRGSSSNVDIEDWYSLWSTPAAELDWIGFDCEDGSKALLECVFAFQTCRFDARRFPQLHQLQLLARDYQAYLAEVELRTSESDPQEVVLHACVVLLHPSRPTITLESTMNASGAWGTVGNGHGSFVTDSALVNHEIPIQVMKTQRVYGQLFHLTCATHTHVHHYRMPSHTQATEWFERPVLPPPTLSIPLHQAQSAYASVFDQLAPCRLPESVRISAGTRLGSLVSARRTPQTPHRIEIAKHLSVFHNDNSSVNKPYISPTLSTGQ